MTDVGAEVLTRDASTATFVRLLGDGDANVTMRARAAEALGRAGGTVSRVALVRALGSSHARLVRQAAGSLGRVGIAANRHDLMPPESAGHQTTRVLAFARSMISYRLGLGTDLLETPAELARIATSKARSMDVVPVHDRRVRAAIESTAAAPVRLTASGALRVTCDGIDTIVALAHDLLRPEVIADALESNQVVGAVLRPSAGTIDLATHLYLLSHPAGGDGIEIFGVRRTGIVALYGIGTVDEDALSFELRSVAGLRSPTMLFVGRYQSGAPRLGFSQAFVAGPTTGAPSSLSDRLPIW